MNSLERPRLVAGFVALSLVFAGALTGCSGSGAGGLAAQACAHIERGLAAAHSASTTTPAQAAKLRAEALAQIRAALPLAAVAAGEDTTWQALEATLSESSRVPLRYLLPALSAQCAGVS